MATPKTFKTASARGIVVGPVTLLATNDGQCLVSTQAGIFRVKENGAISNGEASPEEIAALEFAK